MVSTAYILFLDYLFLSALVVGAGITVWAMNGELLYNSAKFLNKGLHIAISNAFDCCSDDPSTSRDSTIIFAANRASFVSLTLFEVAPEVNAERDVL